MKLLHDTRALVRTQQLQARQQKYHFYHQDVVYGSVFSRGEKTLTSGVQFTSVQGPHTAWCELKWMEQVKLQPNKIQVTTTPNVYLCFSAKKRKYIGIKCEWIFFTLNNISYYKDIMDNFAEQHNFNYIKPQFTIWMCVLEITGAMFSHRYMELNNMELLLTTKKLFKIKKKDV